MTPATLASSDSARTAYPGRTWSPPPAAYSADTRRDVVILEPGQTTLPLDWGRP